MYEKQRLRTLIVTLLSAVLLFTFVGPAPTVGAATRSTLSAGKTLRAGDVITSANKAYRAVMQADGNFVVYKGSAAVWSSRTNGTGADRVVMQEDGNLVVYAKSKAKWASGTGAGGGGGKLVMQDDGNLVTRTPDGRATWSSKHGRTGNTNAQLAAGYKLAAGARLRSKNGSYRAVMQGDGNFVVYKGNKAIWDSGTNGTGANRVVMQGDGNLVVYAGSKARWSAGTNGSGAKRVVMQNDGNLVVYAGNTAKWSSKGGGGGTAPTEVASFQAWALNPANWNSTLDPPARNPGIDVDGVFAAQCADLGIAWSRRIGSPASFGGGQGSSVSKPGWHVVPGNLDKARPGDVVTLVGGAVHVVVVVGTPSNGTVNVVQQNPKSPHVKAYSTTTTGVIWRRN